MRPEKLTDEKVAADRDLQERRRGAASNAQIVGDLICSQEGRPGTSKSPREIKSETGISRSPIRRIAKKDLSLKTFRCREVQLLSDTDIRKRFVACEQLKKRLTKQKLDRTWFSDEKIFTVQAPSNSQNDRLYDNVKSKSDVSAERLLKGRKHFSKHYGFCGCFKTRQNWSCVRAARC